MKTLARQLRLFGDLLTDPRRAFTALGAAPPLVSILVVLGALQAALWVAQSFLLESVAGPDEVAGAGMTADAPPGGVLWLARSLLLLLSPIALALRGTGLAVLLQAGAALGGRILPWRPLVSLVLHLDLVLWLESAAVTLLLAIARPASFEALRALRLHAGLDLVWQPASPAVGALLFAGNLFTIWWGLLLALGLAAVLGLPRRPACGLAAGAWAGLVVVRFVVDRCAAPALLPWE